MVSVAKNRDDLKKRVLRFFGEDSRRAPVNIFLNRLAEKAHVFVFGGLVRDIALSGVASFRSDVDIVFDGDKNAIENIVKDYQYEKNKFGGYRVSVDSWVLDLWQACESWAFSSGKQEYLDINSLLITTITNWDSVLFDWKTKKLICDNKYFVDLRDGYLDILFEENLNEIGMYVKIFRCYASKDVVKFSSKAACLINKALKKYSFEDINNYEMKSYGESRITESIFSYLKNHKGISNPDLLPVDVEKFNQTLSLF